IESNTPRSRIPKSASAFKPGSPNISRRSVSRWAENENCFSQLSGNPEYEIPNFLVCRQFFEEPTVSLDRFAHVKLFLDVPKLACQRINHRHLEILFQEPNDLQQAPAGAEHVNRLCVRLFHKSFLRVGIDFFSG